MKNRSPVPSIISLVCGCIGIFFGMLALIYAVMGGMEYNSYYVMIMDDEVYESCYKACLFFSSVTAALEAAAVTSYGTSAGPRGLGPPTPDVS